MSKSSEPDRKFRGSAVLDLVQTLAIIAGIAFGVVELSGFRAEQSRQAKVELARSINTPEVFSALATVLDLPTGLTAPELRDRLGGRMPEVLFLEQTFETMGILVFNEDLDIEIVDEFFGTGVTASWERLAPLVHDTRARLDQPHFAEWFQWLAERLEEYRSTQAPAPAYEAYSEWTAPW